MPVMELKLQCTSLALPAGSLVGSATRNVWGKQQSWECKDEFCVNLPGPGYGGGAVPTCDGRLTCELDLGHQGDCLILADVRSDVNQHPCLLTRDGSGKRTFQSSWPGQACRAISSTWEQSQTPMSTCDCPPNPLHFALYNSLVPTERHGDWLHLANLPRHASHATSA